MPLKTLKLGIKFLPLKDGFALKEYFRRGDFQHGPVIPL